MPKLITTRTRIADLGKPRVIIIGGGFGGLEVAKGLRGFKAQTVLFDKYNHHCFQPLLYQVATSGLETSSIVFPFRKRFASQEDFFFRLGEVTHIKPEENYIETSIGGVKYDYLVIASGAITNFYGMKDVEQHALPMKTIIDAIKLRNIIIRNFETALLTDDPEMMYSLMRVLWSSQPMRLIAAIPRRPRTMPLDRKSDPIDGIDTYVSIVNVKGPNGPYTRETIVAPALNYFEVVQQLRQGGETIRAQNIKFASPDHAEFLPPAGAAIAQLAEEGGSMTFQAVDIRIHFANAPVLNLTTTEEQIAELKSPLGERLQVVTRVIDGSDRLRVRVYKNAVRKGPARVEGDLLDEIEIQFGGSTTTTKLVENFVVTLARVGMRKFPEKDPR